MVRIVVDMKNMKLLGAVIAHVPASVVADDERVACSLTASGAVRVDVEGEDRCWYYRRTRIERFHGGTDPRTGARGALRYRTSAGRFGEDTLSAMVASLDARASQKASK